MRRSLIFALLLMGLNSVGAQVILIREFMVAFYGNEISIGLILANWIVLEAIGSAWAGRVVERVERIEAWFAILQAVFGLSLPLAVYETRVAKSVIGIAPGEGVGLLPIFYISIFILAPLALSDGAQFPLGCSIYASLDRRSAGHAGRVYILEAIGSAIGGIAFSFFLIRYFHSVRIAIFVGALNMISASLISISSGREAPPFAPGKAPPSSRIFVGVLLSLLVVALVLSVSPGADLIHTRSIERQWHPYELIAYRNSIYGNVAVIRQGRQLTFFADGIPIAASPIPDVVSVEELIHLSLLYHPAPRRILLIGGGIGGVIDEILKHPVGEVHYVELDSLIVRIAEELGGEPIRRSLEHPKVSIQYVDGRLFARRARGRYDVAIVNLPEPSSLQLNRFYTVEFFRKMRELLGGDGILAVKSPGSLTALSGELASLNACIYYTLRGVFAGVRAIPGETNIFLASPSPDILIADPSVLLLRLRERSIETRLLSGFHLNYKLDPKREHWFLGAIRVGGVGINSDLHPVGLFYGLSLWNALFSPGFARIYGLVGRTTLWDILIFLGGIGLLGLILMWRVPRFSGASTGVAVAATGFAGMVIDIVLVFAFQSLYGHIYYRIGLIITAFMMGLAAGGLTMVRALDRVQRGVSDLARIELAFLLYIALLSTILAVLFLESDRIAIFRATQWILLVLSLASGFLVGSEFPLANRIYLESGGTISRSAGALYALDLGGAWLGAISASVVLMPVIGTLRSCAVIFALKLVSLILVAGSRRIGGSHPGKA
ncbi:MAG: hypothetical protein ACUVXI_07480 [bacterium]